MVAVAVVTATAAVPLKAGNIQSGGTGTAIEPTATSTASINPDSCAAAFATVMAQYLKPEIDKHFPGDTAAIEEFVRGVAHAFEIKNRNAPYHFGVRNGLAMTDRLESMQTMGFPISNESFCTNLNAALQGNAMGFDADSADAFLREAMARMYPGEEVKPLSPESQTEFLEAQKKREGIIQTPSGLLFEVLTEGEGVPPTDTDTVKVTYTARLADGTVFDQTERPIQFPVNRLVAGFTEGLKMMKPGGEYRLFIPPALGYGDRGAAGVIPPGAALDFTVRLLDIMPSDTTETTTNK